MLRLDKHGLWAVGLAFAGASLMTSVAAAAESAAVPFKLGTFRAADRESLGLVLNDSTVVDITAANQAWQTRNATAPKLQIPGDMKDLIARYNADLGPRL